MFLDPQLPEYLLHTLEQLQSTALIREEEMYTVLFSDEHKYILEILHIVLLSNIRKLPQLKIPKFLLPLRTKKRLHLGNNNQIIKNIKLSIEIDRTSLHLSNKETIFFQSLPEKGIQFDLFFLVFDFFH